MWGCALFSHINLNNDYSENSRLKLNNIILFRQLRVTRNKFISKKLILFVVGGDSHQNAGRFIAFNGNTKEGIASGKYSSPFSRASPIIMLVFIA